jgi:hypothetical protein
MTKKNEGVDFVTPRGNRRRRGRHDAPGGAVVSKRPATGAPTVGELALLLDELSPFADTHPFLYYRLYQLIGWMLLPDNFVWRQTASKRAMRHAVTRRRLEQNRPGRWDSDGSVADIPDEQGAFQGAANELAKHPAKAKPSTMEADYKRLEQKLPPEHRRRRTYRP